MFLFLKQTYRYYFSNKHLPILFFSNPFIRGYRNKRFIDYKPLREWNIECEYRKKSQDNKNIVKDSGITFSKTF